MQCSEKWLRQFLPMPDISQPELVDTLTRLGLEVKAVTPVAAVFSHVVVGHVLEVAPHPHADRLRVCSVEVGDPLPLSIVCGAANVRAGLKVAVVKVGGLLPGVPSAVRIQKTKLRGVASHGMICSASELGFSEEGQAGILELLPDAPVGTDFRDYYDLNDYCIDIELTPNRGDCASVWGIARELAAKWKKHPVLPFQDCSTPVTHAIKINVDIAEPARCARYVARAIFTMRTDARAPVWLTERLRRSHIRSIHPVVDIANYVMLELGQPLHVFDLDTLQGDMTVRCAALNETITVLGGQMLTLAPEDLVVADTKQAHALAGIRGGAFSAVSAKTKNILLESAYFDPTGIGQSARRLQMHSDSSYRFERGVDPAGQTQAAERFTQLVLEICGGEASALQIKAYPSHLPDRSPIILRRNQTQRILGITLSDEQVVSIVTGLGCCVDFHAEGWKVLPPTYRHDLHIEVDLLEELVRLYGYDLLPSTTLSSPLPIRPLKVDQSALWSTLLSQAGYQEAVNYSFVDATIQSHFDPEGNFLQLANPLTQDMNVMRTSLWPGLIQSLQYNISRQANRVRLFERGVCFIGDAQIDKMAGIVAGNRYPLQWGLDNTAVDFFDIKGDVQQLLEAVNAPAIVWKPAHHPALHPGQSAEIWVSDNQLGFVGAVHPQILQALDLTLAVYVFELCFNVLPAITLPCYKNISKFPAVRRDLAIIVDNSLCAKAITDCIRQSVGPVSDWLLDLKIFDIYQGQGIEPGRKSMALMLVFQDPVGTLVDERVNEMMARIVADLQHTHHVTMRA